MNEYMPRFRKINDALKEIKEIDPNNTELNWKLIQKFMMNKKLTKLKIGNTWLVNIDELFKLFTKEKKDEISISRENL